MKGPIPYDKMASWPFGDFIFASGFDNISSAIKARRAGFHSCIDTKGHASPAVRTAARHEGDSAHQLDMNWRNPVTLLFDPIRLGAIVARNRILMAPLTRARLLRQRRLRNPQALGGAVDGHLLGGAEIAKMP